MNLYNVDFLFLGLLASQLLCDLHALHVLLDQLLCVLQLLHCLPLIIFRSIANPTNQVALNFSLLWLVVNDSFDFVYLSFAVS